MCVITFCLFLYKKRLKNKNEMEENYRKTEKFINYFYREILI